MEAILLICLCQVGSSYWYRLMGVKELTGFAAAMHPSVNAAARCWHGCWVVSGSLIAKCAELRISRYVGDQMRSMSAHLPTACLQTHSP